MAVKPSKPFSCGTEYENFLYYFCCRCNKGKIRQDGFPYFPENGGCPTWDALEYARLGAPFPSKKIVSILNKDGGVRLHNFCMEFQANDENLMAAYKSLLQGDDNAAFFRPHGEKEETDRE